MPYAKKFEYAIKYSLDCKPEILRDCEIEIKKGIDVKILTRKNKELEKKFNKWKKVIKNIKKIKNKGVAIAINDNSTLISLIKSNTTLLIKDGPFNDIMKDLFLSRYSKK